MQTTPEQSKLETNQHRLRETQGGSVRRGRDSGPHRGSGARSWKAAFEKLYDIPADIGEHSSAGETDPQVARAFQGVLGRDPSDDELGKLYAQYLLHLAEDIVTSAGAPRCKADPGTHG